MVPASQFALRNSSLGSGSSLKDEIHCVRPLTLPKSQSLCSRHVLSSVRFSVVPLRPPVAVCWMSMCVSLASSSCSLMDSVTVASPIALRVSQPIPCSARAGSALSERVLFWEKGGVAR